VAAQCRSGPTCRALPAGAPVWPVDLHHGEVLLPQVARSGRRRSGRRLPSRPCPAARAGSASPAAGSTAALAVSRELLVAQQPSLLVETAAWWVRPWVSTAPMTTWCAWACWWRRSARARARPGTGRAGRAHQRPGLAPRLVSGHRRPSGRVYVHPALPGQANSSRDDTTVRAVQGQGGSGSDPPSRTSPIITDRRQLDWRVRSNSATHGCGAQVRGLLGADSAPG
jgi:hypothetical protein